MSQAIDPTINLNFPTRGGRVEAVTSNIEHSREFLASLRGAIEKARREGSTVHISVPGTEIDFDLLPDDAEEYSRTLSDGVYRALIHRAGAIHPSASHEMIERDDKGEIVAIRRRYDF